MTPRERLEAVLQGNRPDRVPFAIYGTRLPRGEWERYLRNEGACLVLQDPPVYRSVYSRVSLEELTYTENQVTYIRTHIQTPRGALTAVERVSPEDDSRWPVERLFKGPEDYGALSLLIQDQKYLANYEAFKQAQRLLGNDGFLRAEVGYSPLQEIIYTFMGLDTFAVEWAERRDEVMRLYDVLVENRRRLYPIVAKSPALAANYCGNVSPEVVGVKRFEAFYLPHYNEFAEVMHAEGKVLGVHLDDNNWALSDLIGGSEIDYVEAFTPRPDSDMGVAEAMTAWPGKVLWLHFPSSVQVMGTPAVERTTRQFLYEAAPGDRLVVGITEAVPPQNWRENFVTILKVLNEEGRCPVSLENLQPLDRRTVGRFQAL